MRKRKKFYLLIVLFLSLFIAKNVSAASSDNIIKVHSENDLINCISDNNICMLEDDISLSSELNIKKNVILDLNGNVISPDKNLKLKSGLISISRGAKINIIDTKGNGKITTGPTDNVWAAIQLVAPNDDKNGTGLSELVVDGGIIEGYYYGITGNGTRHNTKLTVNSGTIRALNDDSAGIFQPQIGTVEINGGDISGGTGIEIRSGSLTINNGNITGTAKNFSKVVNKSGTTTNGVGVTVSQHTTKNPIDVVINNGNISGIYGLYEWNPHKNDSIDKVKISINDGNFKTVSNDGSAVYSEDLTSFIHGGKFNSDVSKYLASDAKTTFKENSNNKVNKSNNKDFLPLIIIITILSIPIIYLISKSIKSKK